MGPGATFWFQHHVLPQGQDTVSIFDDGGAPPTKEPQSRAILLNLDTGAMRATLQRSYVHPAGLAAANQGSMQVLADGEVLVGWGNLPYFSQFREDGTLILDGHFPVGDVRRRAGARQHERLDRRSRVHDRRLHGDPEHPDHQRLAARYRGRHRDRCRQRLDSTAYLIGEIVVIPLTDYLSRVFSFRRYLLVNAVLFPLFSIGCAFTHDLGSMIVMRGLQGFAGGILIPMAFTIVLTKLPKPQQPIGLALFSFSR